MEEKEVAASFSEMAADYEIAVDQEMSAFWGLNYSAFIDDYIQNIQVEEGSIVLDLATGTAVIPRKLICAFNQHFTMIGLDLTFEMLRNARLRNEHYGMQNAIRLTCANALGIPFKSNSISTVTCALATHHMKASKLTAEIFRVLEPGGRLFLTDVGMSVILRLPVVGHLVRLGTWIYFVRKQGRARAKAEVDAVENVLTPEEWMQQLQKAGFKEIRIKKLRTKYFWVPPPIQIFAKK